jgi:hypothetical protein
VIAGFLSDGAVLMAAGAPDSTDQATGSGSVNQRYTTISEYLYSLPAMPQLWLQQDCSIAQRNLTQAEWLQYVGSTYRYQKTCSDLPAGT